MTVNQDTLKFASGATQHLTSMMLLRQLSSEARESVVDVLAAAVVRVDACEIADYLAGEPLEKAKAAAAELTKALEAATKARDAEEHSVTARLAAFLKRKVDGTVAPGEGEPPRETAKLRQLRAAEEAAEQAAFVAAQPLRYHEEQIAGLRGAPSPDRETLAVLAAALRGCRDAD